jgi:outer membrane receptor protein involved in Fe transport
MITNPRLLQAPPSRPAPQPGDPQTQLSRLPAVVFLVCSVLGGGWLMTVQPLPAQTTSTVQGTVTDSQGRALPGAVITLSGPLLAKNLTVTTDAMGSYRLLGLPAGTYSLLAEKSGFASRRYDGLVVTVNRRLALDVALPVGRPAEVITVSARPPLIETASSSSGRTILPEEIQHAPINGRNYLDLMQLVPGVAVNRQKDTGTDAAVPILGERGGNATFLIDGMPNSNEVDGGAAAPFDQDSILEFQVLTAGYKAEFGHGSGGVVNVVTKSGTDRWHGLASVFHRNSALDSSDVAGKRTPFLMRWDPSVNLGGPLLADRIGFFGSLERIREDRELNFIVPPRLPQFLAARERAYDQRNRTFETRGFLKLDEQLGRHRLTEQMNEVNGHVTDFLPLSAAINLPSTRTASSARYLMAGLHDTATLGSPANPWVMNAYLQYRGEPSSEWPAHPEAGPATTLFNLFSSPATGGLFGDLGQIEFGAGFTPLLLAPQYASAGAHFNHAAGRHEVAGGGDFERDRVNGTEATNLFNQLFATVSDFAQFGPVNSGVYTLAKVGGSTPQENRIRLRNHYTGLFVQDDWKLAKRLTANLGLRWDYDSRFPRRANVSPRLGVAWSPTPQTVVNASWGVFYDHFRLGLARDVPAFGGANLLKDQTISYPRLFYGDPTSLARLEGLCLSSVLTDAQIQATGATCPAPGLNLFGVDHLNGVVAPGHAPVPPDSVVNVSNVQALTGLTAQQFADAASRAVGRAPGFFFWGGFGHLTMNFVVPQIFSVPVTVDRSFSTPYTVGFHLGAQHQVTRGAVIQADYYHRDIRNILGVRTANLAFAARLPGHTGELEPGTGTRPILSYGPWYQGRYDSIIAGIRKPMSGRFTLEASYAWTQATDNDLHSSLVSEVQTGLGAGLLGVQGPTDSFVGVPPVVTDPVSGRTNAQGPFIASNGNPVPKAGRFYNGANLDRGPSDLALNHTVLFDGILRLPRQWEMSGIFRAQSGFHFSDVLARPVDVDGDGIFNGVDFFTGRNHFQAPPYVNLDARFSKQLTLGEKARARVMIEFFNLLNRANPAAVEPYRSMPTPFGKPLQYLPGREGQLGAQIEF